MTTNVEREIIYQIKEAVSGYESAKNNTKENIHRFVIRYAKALDALQIKEECDK